MTPNQLIVLLDVHRGYDRKRHMATIVADLWYLSRLGYIRENDKSPFGWSTTQSGNTLVQSLVEIADFNVAHRQHTKPMVFGETADSPTQRDMFERSFQRPRDFQSLTPERKWEIDKDLGILDWEGKDLTEEDKKRLRDHYLPAKPPKKTGAKCRKAKTAARQ